MRASNEILLKMEEVVEKIELLKLVEGIETFRITEKSNKFGVKEMLVHNLSFEIDKNKKQGTWIMASDLEDKILNNHSALMVFLPESILSIDGLCIKFEGVTVNIEATDIQYEE